MNDAAEPIGKTKIRCRANEQQIQQQVIASNEILQRTVRTLSERGLASTRSHSPEKRNSRWRHDARPSSRGCQKRTSGPGRMPRVQARASPSTGLRRIGTEPPACSSRPHRAAARCSGLVSRLTALAAQAFGLQNTADLHQNPRHRAPTPTSPLG